MNINTYLREKFQEDIKVVKTDKGLTNDIYYGNIRGTDCVIRVPKDDIENIINIDNEKKVLELVRKTGLDVEELYYFEDSRVRITRYIESAEFAEVKSGDSIVRVAELLKRFHSYRFRIGSDFDAVDMLYKYYNSIYKPLYDIHEYLYIAEDIRKIDNEHFLCHNDLVSGNILFTEDRTYLIDYEYAADNDPLFDLTSFTTENNLSDEESRLFYNSYYDNKIDPGTSEQLIRFERFQNLLWLCWANMMFDNRKEQVYADIAGIKYEQLLHSVRKDTL